MLLRVAALTALLSASLPCLAQGTKVWTVSHMEEWEKGRPQGVAISSDGSVAAAPAATLIATTPSTYIWAISSDAAGNAYAATGSPATVLRIARDGRTTTLFKTKDLAVQAVRVGPDGFIYVATMPSGKVYRLPANATEVDAEKAAVVFDPEKLSAEKADAKNFTAAKENTAPRYIWDLAFSASGALYVATGGPASIYRIAQPAGDARAERFFESNEQHIRTLLFEKDGNLLAGSDGDGLVYRIGKDGKGFILFNAPKREVTALAESPEGKIYVATVGEKGKSNLPPLPVQGIAAVTATITIVTPGSVQASNTNSLVPDGSDVFELDASGAARKLWAPHDDVVYALHVTRDGLLAATGNRGRIYRIQENGEFADIAHIDASQITSFAEAPAGGLYLGTSNSGKLFQLSANRTEGTLLSEVQDAGAVARWGRPEVDGAGYQLFARSGNVSNADRGWSDWQAAAANTPVPVPQARFAQWKLVLKPEAQVHAIALNYLPVNVAPVVDEVAVLPGARVNQQAQFQPAVQSVTINLPSAASSAGVSAQPDPATQPLQGIKDRGAVTARWAAHDDNGDELVFALYYRAAGEHNWQLLKDDLSDRYYSFDAAQLPDGAYQLKVVASDAPSHNPGEALTSERTSERFVLDTASPAIAALTARLDGGRVHIVAEAKDPSSPIARAEYSIDAGPWQYIEPVGKLSDALTERYDFEAPLSASPSAQSRAARLPPADPAQHVVTLRVFDRYENSATAKSVVR